MATESPNIRDTQTIAAAAYNQGNSLSGFGGSAQYLVMKLSTSADRTAVLCSAATDVPYGILQNDPAQGAPCDICTAGVCKAVAGAAITRGALLGIDTSGRVVTYSSSGTNQSVGLALESAAGANNVITIQVSPRGKTPN